MFTTDWNLLEEFYTLNLTRYFLQTAIDWIWCNNQQDSTESLVLLFLLVVLSQLAFTKQLAVVIIEYFYNFDICVLLTLVFSYFEVSLQNTGTWCRVVLKPAPILNMILGITPPLENRQRNMFCLAFLLVKLWAMWAVFRETSPLKIGGHRVHALHCCRSVVLKHGSELVSHSFLEAFPGSPVTLEFNPNSRLRSASLSL